MFGRQMEAQLVISFLLNTQTRGSDELEVLPIGGPHRVGKSNLFWSKGKDGRVCVHFSEILFLGGDDFTDYNLITSAKGFTIEHHNTVLNSSKGRGFVVAEYLN